MDARTLAEQRVEIQFLDANEMEVIRELAHRIWPVAYAEILSQAQLEYMLEWLYNLDVLQNKASTGYLYYAVRVNGVPVGFIGLEPNFPDAGYLRVHNIYLLPDFQGTGLGRAMLNHCMDVAFDLDQHTLHLNVNRFNKAREFYEHVGFRIVGEEDIDIGQGYLMEDYIMELRLFPDRT